MAVREPGLNPLHTPKAEVWGQYEAWNEGIHREIFSGQWSGQPVYLDLEQDVLDQIADSVKADGDDPAGSLVAAVKPTLHPLPDGIGFFAEHLHREREWRSAGSTGTPPFLAVLAFVSLCAEGMRTDEVFRSSNYYGRLAAMLGVESNGSARTKIVRGFMDESHVLWASLNSWLEDHEGRLGLPTAHAFDYRVHVGVPMSQALVAAGDRLILRDLFIAYRLRPGQSLSRSDMARLIRDWLPASGVSQGLKRLCHAPEALERVADIATIELQAWDGAPREVRRVDPWATVDLLLSAVIRQHPRPQLHLEFGVHTLAGLPSGEYVLVADAGAHAAAALESSAGKLTLLDQDSTGWRGFAEIAQVSMADVMFASLRLVRSNVIVRRAPVRLVVLEYDEEQRRHVEVNRVTLGRDNLLLCHESLAPALDAALTPIARPGYRRRTGGELPGLPEGWAAYEPVEILAISQTTNADLAALVPMSWTQVSLGGGYPLPGHLTWLRGMAPEVRASSAVDRELSVSLTCERALGATAPEARELARFSGSTVIALDSEDLPDGDYRIAVNELSEEGSTLGSNILRIRSADHPRPYAPGWELSVGYDLSSSALGALSAKASEGASAVRGASVPPEDDDASAVPAPLQVPRQLGVVGASPEADIVELGPDHVRAHGGEAPLCLMGTTGHHWVLPGGDRHPWLQAGWEGTCKHCGLDKWFPRRPGFRRGERRSRTPYRRRGVRAPSNAAEAETRLEAPPLRQDTTPDLDMLLEALSFAQQGSWASYELLARGVDDAPWFPLESARLLAALGHVDIRLASRNLRPERWVIAPPVLSSLEPGSPAVLSGYRPRSLVYALRELAEAAGGQVNQEPLTGSPTRITIEGLALEALHELTKPIQQTLQIELAVQQAPAPRLASRLPALEDVITALPSLSRGLDAPVEQFDFGHNRWARTDEIRGAGAYRFITAPTVFAVKVAHAAEMKVADNRLVKWIAAWTLNLEMLAYESASETLRSPLGAQLPGLYERAAVLASGCPPVQRTDGTVTYAQVPSAVAAALWTKLGCEVHNEPS